MSRCSTGGGFFSSAAGGLKVVADSLVGHLAYGLVVGVLAGGTHELAFSTRHQFESEPRARRAA